MSFERRHFRVEYPIEARPSIKIGKHPMPVLNLSERGILFGGVRDLSFNLGEMLKGIVVFNDKEEVVIEGEILRTDKDTCALRLSTGVPFSRIMAEQRYLINRFGTLRQAEKPD